MKIQQKWIRSESGCSMNCANAPRIVDGYDSSCAHVHVHACS
jgi:hypothetical protein